jgi:hypothetical protein
MSQPQTRLSVPARFVTPRPLTEAEVTVLTDVAGILIPGHAQRPEAAKEPGFTEKLAVAANARADAFDVLTRAIGDLDGLRGPGLARAVRELHEREPQAFQVLSSVIAGAWLLTPGARNRIGYLGQQSRPAGLTEAADELSSGILDPVLGMHHDTPPRWAR